MPSPVARARAGLLVAMALYGDLTHDSRVIREAEALAGAGHTVTIACLDASPATIERLAPQVRVVTHRPDGTVVLPGDPSPFREGNSSWLRRQVDRVRWLWLYRSANARWGRAIVAAVGPVDVWHAHDLTGLEAVAPNVNRRTRMVYDSHELFLDIGSAARFPWFARSLLRLREARLVARCQAVITVNAGLAQVLERRYHPARIEVVRNCPERWDPPPVRPNLIRERLNLPPDTPIVLFHGALVPGRGIGTLVRVLDAPGLEGVHIVLMGKGSLATALGDSDVPVDPARLHVLPAVPPDQLLDWVASADVGTVLIEPDNMNLVLSTPNKLFESISAGTPVLAADLPEIRRVVMDDPEGPLGVLCDPVSHEAVADALRAMLAQPRVDLLEMSRRCRRAADERLNWSAEVAGLLRVYER